MLEALQTTVRQIAVFMICAQAISQFRPKEAYEKYLRMLLGAMVLIQLFLPFCKLFLGVSGQSLLTEVEKFQYELDISMSEAVKQSLLAEEKLESMSLQEVQERLDAGRMEAEQKKQSGQEKSTGEENHTSQIEGMVPAQIEKVAPVQIEIMTTEE